MGWPAQASPEPVGVGVVGLGTAGRQAVRELLRSSTCRLAAVCDADQGVAQRVASGHDVPPYGDVEQLCGDPAVEAVYVATPTFLHVEHAAMAMKLGRHVLVEKPVAATSAEALELVRMADIAGVAVMAVNTRGRDAPVTQMAECVRAGRIGRLLNITNVWQTNWMLRPRFEYELDPARGGGIVFRQAPHQVEIVREIAGAPVRAVTAVAHPVTDPVATVGHYSAVLEFATGASAVLAYNGCGFLDSGLLTFGVREAGLPADDTASREWRQARTGEMDKSSEARTYSIPLIGDASARSPEECWGFSGLTIVNGDRGDIRQTIDGVSVYGVDGRADLPAETGVSGLARDLDDLCSSLRTGARSQHDARWGAETVAVCEALWRSAHEHKRVEVEAL